MTRTLILSLALALLLAPAAQADDTAVWDALIAATPATEGVLYAAARAADRYWIKAGLPPSCPADLRMYTEPGTGVDVDARGDIGGCAVYIDRRWMRQTREAMRAGIIGAWEILFTVMVHERGHNLGLLHDDPQYRVMDPHPPLLGLLPVAYRWAQDQQRRSRGYGPVKGLPSPRIHAPAGEQAPAR